VNKYIKLFEEKINESSIGKGSIVLIKGKPEKGKRKLFATHITGFVELKAGAVMLFLADDFYRIKEEDGKLKSVKISYKNEDSLKSVLNLKSPGKISAVRNNNKTPFHWKTLKHTNLNSALREVEKDLIDDSYIFESVDSNKSADSKYGDLFNEIILALDSALNGNNEEIKITKFHSSISDLKDELIENIEDGDDGTSSASVDWTVEIDLILYSEKFDSLLKKYNLSSHGFGLVLEFKSTGQAWDYQVSSGSYDSPPDRERGANNIETEFTQIWITSDYGEIDDEFILTDYPEVVKFTESIKDPSELIGKVEKVSPFHQTLTL
jgi:hypothetical protein